jgi:predicted phage terminase large subunit-like protein
MNIVTSLPQDRHSYRPDLDSLLTACSRDKVDPNPIVAEWAKADLFFLLVYVLGRRDADSDWTFQRCREVQASPDGHLDLWARGHYKSTIITYALTIWDIINDPEITVGVFSHTRPIAKAFLRQIKRELETNQWLKSLFPDTLYADPQNESPKWSEDEGITVKRKSNPKEATVEAWGLVDGQPTSKHYRLRVYDDVVTRESVTTPEMMAKTTEAFELSLNLGSRGGIMRGIGTRYHFNDTYRTVMERGTLKARLYPATSDGMVDGEPVYLSRDELAQKRRDMGPYVFGAQMLQDPTADEKQGFKMQWIKHARTTHRGHNLVILVDAASAKKKTSDYTAMWCLGLGPDKNLYVHDMLRDRLSLTERADALFAWHRKWQPMAVGYERYGLMADVEHFKDRMDRENYRFTITELGGVMAKADRIRRLIPWFEQGRIYIPPSLTKTNYEGRTVDLVQSFTNDEYLPFPVGTHDDMLDALARFLDEDLPIAWPAAYIGEDDEDEYERQGVNATTGY